MARRLLIRFSVTGRQERYAEALRRAAEELGSEVRLAGFLGIEREQLQRWLDREDDVPLSAFLSALGVIADGPYARDARRIRVAVIGNDTLPRRGGSSAS